MKPAIVVCAHTRPDSLARLLESVSRGHYPSKVPLVISIDHGGARGSEVEQVAENFVWGHGKKRVIRHHEHLGPNRHAFFVGSLTNEFGSVIRLEDDYFVSPRFYDFAVKALDYYRSDPRIAGISLYTLWFNGITREPFIPYPDHSFVYFVQTSWSHGQAFLHKQWKAYEDWYSSTPHTVSKTDRLHDAWSELGKDDWLPPAAKYLVASDRYYVFPRESFCTNVGDVGAHFTRSTRLFQVPLQTRRRAYRFTALKDSFAVYDAFQEMQPDILKRLAPEMARTDFELDLNGTKDRSKIRRPFVLTTRSARNTLRGWGWSLYPPEANIVENVSGTDISLCRTEDVRWGLFGGFWSRYRRYEIGRTRMALGFRAHFVYWLLWRLIRMGSTIFRSAKDR